MKNITMHHDYDYTPASDRRITVRFIAGVTYYGVLDAAADHIAQAGAGYIQPPGELSPYNEWATPMAVDASHAWKRRR